MARAYSRFFLPAVFGLVLACSKSSPDLDANPGGPAMLRVENQAFSDMTIYIISGAQKVRLGIANGNSTQTFSVPSQYTTSGPVQFLADPIGSSRTPVSDRLVVSPGDIVTLRIPPN